MKNPPFPKTRTCTIREMIDFASANHGKSKVARKDAIMREALGNITQLSKIDVMRWRERKWALKALKAIEAIGIMDKLELLATMKPEKRNEILDAKNVTSFNQMGKVATCMGLQVHKVNGRVIILRSQQTNAEDVPICKADTV